MCVVEEFVYTPAGVLLLEEKFILVTVILTIGKHVETNTEKTKLGVVSANPQSNQNERVNRNLHNDSNSDYIL